MRKEILNISEIKYKWRNFFVGIETKYQKYQCLQVLTYKDKPKGKFYNPIFESIQLDNDDYEIAWIDTIVSIQYVKTSDMRIVQDNSASREWWVTWYLRSDRMYATWAILNKKATIATLYEDGRLEVK